MVYIPALPKDQKLDGSYFFDTNIWLYLQGPYPDPGDLRTRSYSAFFKRILDSGGTVCIAPAVVSEFANRFIKLQHDFLVKTEDAPQHLKDFRQTAEYGEITENLSDELHHLIGPCTLIDSNLNKSQYDSVCEHLKPARLDFNDAVIVELCATNELPLVTHDFDFDGCGLEIWSSNGKYKN